jgi:hypothetical protein
MSLAPLGMVSEKEILKAAQNKDRGQAGGGVGGGFGGGRDGLGAGMPVGVRRAPTNQDFQSLLHASMGLLNRAQRRVPAVKRALIDTQLASSKFEFEQSTRNYLDQTTATSSGIEGIGQTQSMEQNRNRAKKLLSEQGIDVEGHEQSIALISLKARPQAQESVVDTDVEGYLAVYQDNIVETAIDESLRQTAADACARADRVLDNDWAKMRDHIKVTTLSRGGVRSADAAAADQDMGMSMEGGGTTAGGGINVLGADALDDMKEYALEVRRYHDTTSGQHGRTSGSKYNLAQRFEIASTRCKEGSEDEVGSRSDAWILLRYYVGEEHARPETLPGAQREDQNLPSKWQFRTERASENGPLKYDASEGATGALRLEFARRACTFLEAHFLALQVEQPNASLGGGGDLLIPANDGGRSSVGPIFGILDRLERNDVARRLSAEERCWMRVYYCLRCGGAQGRAHAISLVKEQQGLYSGHDHEGVLPKVVEALEQWQQCFDFGRPYTGGQGGNVVQPRWLDRLVIAAKGLDSGNGSGGSGGSSGGKRRHSFKRAVLILLAQSGGAPLHHVSRSRNDARMTFKRLLSLGLHKSLNHSEDFIWHRLSIAVATQHLDGQDTRYTVEDLSRFIVDCGPSYFSPNHENPMLYFSILLMAQEFEQALDYLHFQHRTVDAVHFALAMYYYGMLQIRPGSEAGSAGSSATTSRGVGMEHGWGLYSPVNGFAFHRLLDGYCKDFSQVWPGMAADYYAMLHDEDLMHREAGVFGGDGGGLGGGDAMAGRGEPWKDSWRLHYLMRLVLYTRKPNHLSDLIGDPGPQSRHSMLYSLLGDRKATDCITRAAQQAEASGEMDVAIQLFRRTRNGPDFNRALRLLNGELASCMQPHASAERRADYEAFAWEFVRMHLVNASVSPDYVDQSGFVTGGGGSGSGVGGGGQAELRLFLAQTRALKCQLAMCKFFKRMYEGKWGEARVEGKRTKLISFDQVQGQGGVGGYRNDLKESIVANFNSLDSSVKGNYGLFLAEYMRCLHTLFQEAQLSQGAAAGSDHSSSSAYLTSLRREAVVLRNHAMCIDGQGGQYMLTDHDMRKLMQYESNMRV